MAEDDPLGELLAALPDGPSPVKLLAFLELLGGLEPAQLAELLPGVPPPFVAAMLATAARQVPQDAGRLDDWMVSVGRFAFAMRSDTAAPVELIWR